MFYKPTYPDKTDYQTNAPTYGDDLARKTELIKYLSHRIWEYDKELAARFLAWDKNLEEFDEEVIRLLKEWIDDGTFAHIINEEIFSWKLDTTIHENFVATVNQLFEEIHKKVGNLAIDITSKPYNAKRDTDITPILQQAVTDLKGIGGGTIKIPHGTYIVEGAIDLPSNITIQGDEGTVLTKTFKRTAAYMFTVGRTMGQKGYGGGAKNVTIDRIIFKGIAQDATWNLAIALSFNHAENLKITNCQFVECITRDHAIDLAGCNDVLIENCKFVGAWHFEGREYNECIQIDSSTPGSITNFINYDALPTKDVLITGCQFIPSYKENGTIHLYAPNPVGSHGFTGGKYYTNIVFSDNLVVDPWNRTNASGGNDWFALIHFYGLKDSKFLNNQFIFNEKQDQIVFGFYTSERGYHPETMASTDGLTPMPCLNIDIIGNVVRGLANPENVGAIYHAYGLKVGETIHYTGNFTIADNQFDSNLDSMDNSRGGKDLMRFNYATNMRVLNNKADMSHQFLKATNSKELTVSGNHVTRTNVSGVSLTNVDRVMILDNIFNTIRKPFEMYEVEGAMISNNFVNNILNDGTDDSFDFATNMRNCIDVMMSNNVLRTFDSSIEYGCYIYQTDKPSRNIYTFDNLFTGFGSTDIYVTGTITNRRER